MHLVIYFSGTGNPGDDFVKNYNYVNDELVKTVFVNGCEHPEVCNTPVFPNLRAFAKKFTQKIFKIDNGSLRLASDDLSHLHIGIQANRTTASAADGNITGLTLCGYSRGAVTCYEVARCLQATAPQIPIDIIADNPVPGNSGLWLFSNARNVADCSDLTNIKHSTIILGSYTGREAPKEKVSLFHRLFFSQIVPKVPNSTDSHLIAVPREHHNKGKGNVPENEEYLNLRVGQRLQKINHAFVNPEKVKNLQTKICRLYQNQDSIWSNHYPDTSDLQGIFGLNREELYHHKDPLHPAPLLRDSDQWGPRTNYLTWWNERNKKASFISSKETKELVKVIQEAEDNKNSDTLKKLYQQTEDWMLQKQSVNSSRYEFVQRLRDNAYDQLYRVQQVPKAELMNLHAQVLRKNDYFCKHWLTASQNASFFKTEQTRVLDRAFVAHRHNEISDAELLAKLETWMDAKKDTKSKRFRLVESIADHLKDIIGNAEPVQGASEVRSEMM